MPPLLFLATSLVLAAQAPDPIRISDCQFGEVAAFSIAECTFDLENLSGRTIHVSVDPMDPDDQVKPSDLTLAPEQTAEVIAKVDVGHMFGDVQHAYRVTIAEIHGAGFAHAAGFALGTLDQLRPHVDFGSVNVAARAFEKSIELTSHNIADFRILRIIDSPSWVEASIAQDRRTLKVRIRPSAPWALLSDDIKLEINTPRQAEAWVHVSGDIHGPISAEKNPFSFGFVAPGHDREVHFDLYHANGKAFRVGSVQVEGIDGNVTVSDCEPKKAGCRTIVLHLSDDQKPGFVRGDLTVELPEYERTLTLNVWGILQSPPTAKGKSEARERQTISHDETGPMVKSGHATASGNLVENEITEANRSGLVPKRSLVKPAAATESQDKPRDVDLSTRSVPAPPPGSGPLLKWSTADEDSVHGYQVFRSDAADGPFVLQNAKTVRAHSDAKSIYRWRDPTAESGKTYWYYVGVVYNNGQKQQLSGAQKVVAH